MICVNLNYVLPELLNFERRFKIKTNIEKNILLDSISEISKYADPKYVFIKLDNSFTDLIKSKSKDLSKLLANSCEIFLVLCTIGTKYMDLLNLTLNDLCKTMYIDRLASDIVENTASFSQIAIFNKFYDTSFYKMTRRYSPGYGDFDLNNQKLIFDYLKNYKKNFNDIILNEKYIMIPEKSISYIFGVEKL